MSIIDNSSVTLDEWRPGVLTRKLAGAFSKVKSLFFMEQTLYSGKGAPLHVHQVEELLYIKSGALKVSIDTPDEVQEFNVSTNQTVVIPSSYPHSFVNETDSETVLLVFFPHSDPFDLNITKYL